MDVQTQVAVCCVRLVPLSRVVPCTQVAAAAAVAATPSAAAACYDWNIQLPNGTISLKCNTAINSLGVSYHDRLADGWSGDPEAAPFDQGLVWMDDGPDGQPRPGPYYQYNYIENINPASTTNTWQVNSYSSVGSNSTDVPACGCRSCPNTVTCNLAKTGPRTGALEGDAARPGNLAYNPFLENCLGGSGSCMSLNGEACCIGTSSYEYKPPAGQPCVENCRNYWSSISSTKPLSELWDEPDIDMPQEDMSWL